MVVAMQQQGIRFCIPKARPLMLRAKLVRGKAYMILHCGRKDQMALLATAAFQAIKK